MVEIGGLAFDVDMTLNAHTDSRPVEYTVSHTGDFFAGYTIGRVSATPERSGFEASVILVNEAAYVRESSAREWSAPSRERPPYGIDAALLFIPDPDSLDNLSLDGQEEVNGTDCHVISGERHYSQWDVGGPLSVVYWIGVEDGLVRRITARGELSVHEIYRDLVLFGDLIEERSVTIALTAELSDFGKSVDVATPDMLVGRYGHHAINLDDGRVLVSGGFTGVANNNVIIPFPNDLVQTYDQRTGLWTTDGSFLQEYLTVDDQPTPVFGSLAQPVKLSEGTVLLIGLGAGDAEEPVTVVNILHPDSGTVMAAPSPLTPRLFPSTAILRDGALALVSGMDLMAGQLTSIMQIFNPQTGRWRQVAPMAQGAVAQAIVTLNDGRLLAAGGSLDLEGREPLARVEIYDPETNDWTTAMEMGIKRSHPRAILLPDGRVLAVGRSLYEDNAMWYTDDGSVIRGEGLRSDATSEIDPETGWWKIPWEHLSAETYDPHTGAWTLTNPMNDQRHLPALTLLPDGRVLASGGIRASPDSSGGPEDVLATTEIFDPETNAWSRGPALREARMNHTATVLSDGTVLLAGGIGVASESGEVYPTPHTEVIDP